MTPGGRVFRRLISHLTNYQFIDWVDFEADRTIQDYAERIKSLVDDPENCDVLGVSFGGIVAQELARLINAERCYIVSSLCDPGELNTSHKILATLPSAIYDKVFASSEKALSGIDKVGVPLNTSRLKKLIGEDGDWYRWATTAVSRWDPSPKGSVSYIRIHGDSDDTFKRGHIYSDHVIQGATHVLALTHADELARILSIYQPNIKLEVQR